MRTEHGRDVLLGQPVAQRAGAAAVDGLEHAAQLGGVDEAVAVGVGGGELRAQGGEVAERRVGEEGRGGLPRELGGGLGLFCFVLLLVYESKHLPSSKVSPLQRRASNFASSFVWKEGRVRGTKRLLVEEGVRG